MSAHPATLVRFRAQLFQFPFSALLNRFGRVEQPLIFFFCGLELIEQDRVSGTQQATSYNVYDGHGSVRALTVQPRPQRNRW
jgi:hypothetical protein